MFIIVLSSHTVNSIHVFFRKILQILSGEYKGNQIPPLSAINIRLRIDKQIICGYTKNRKRALPINGCPRDLLRSNRIFTRDWRLLLFCYRDNQGNNGDDDQCVLKQCFISNHSASPPLFIYWRLEGKEALLKEGQPLTVIW